MAKQMRPKEFGKFMLEEHMGRGGMASVYRAIDTETSRTVAVKIFQLTEERGPDVVKRLRDREVRMLIACEHPNIVRYFESGEVGDNYYYVMEFVQTSLAIRMRHGPYLELNEKVSVIKQTAAALAAVHRTGVVHRDVKPGNILLDDSPELGLRVKITDLGIAKNVVETDIAQTLGKKIPGTPKYLAPEQIKLQPVDGRADIFALGVMGFEMLSDETPFTADSPDDYLKVNCEQQPRSLKEAKPELPDTLCKVIMKCLEKDREKRYDAEILCDDLQRVEDFMITGLPIPPTSQVGSVFYEAPPEVEAQVQPIPVALWAVSILIFVAGLALLVFGLKPLPPAPARPKASIADLVELPPPTGSQLLEQAQAAVKERAFWDAYGLLSPIRRDDKSEGMDAVALEKTEKQVHAILGAPLAKEIETLLSENKPRRAQLALERLQDLFPQHPSIPDLGNRLREMDKALTTGAAKTELVARVQQLESQGKRSEAFDAIVAFGSGSADLGSEQTASRMASEYLNTWGAGLLKGTTDEASYPAFEKALLKYQELKWPDKAEDVRFKFWIEKARAQLKAERAPKALEYIVRAEGLASKPADKNAVETLKAECLLKLREFPISYDEFAAKTRESGFGGAMWRAMSGQGIEIKEKEGRLEIGGNAAALRPGSPTGLETARPIDNRAFQVTAKFKASLPPPSSSDQPQFVAEVRGDRNTWVQLWFGKDGYQLSISDGKNKPTVSPASPAFGNEGEAFTEISLMHNDIDQKLEVKIGGKTLPRKDLSMGGNLQVRFYVLNPGNGNYSVEVRDLEVKKPY
ncbi:MAG TPA: serine/threonine-protein kinase [Candidatus Brocadiia bacterium]|nr:serine/threonine-protein kinase [Candidatus Brocadiia bacterium]